MAAEQKQKLYLIHDTTRGHVGNSMVWWRKNHCGYTCDVKFAHRFTRKEAINLINKADDLVAYPVGSVLAVIEHHCIQKPEGVCLKRGDSNQGAIQ